MYKIQAQNLVSKDVLERHPDIKKHVITDMLINLADVMFKNNCIDLTEKVREEDSDYINPNEVQFNMIGFVMTPKEHKESCGIVKAIIDSCPSYIDTDLLKRLKFILTHEPEK